jgi:hypothetical protein
VEQAVWKETATGLGLFFSSARRGGPEEGNMAVADQDETERGLWEETDDDRHRKAEELWTSPSELVRINDNRLKANPRS